MKRIPRTIPMFFLLFGLVLLALPAFAATGLMTQHPHKRAQPSAGSGHPQPLLTLAASACIPESCAESNILQSFQTP